MVTQGEKLKTIADKLINKFGNTATLRKYDAPTYDDWGEPTYSSYIDTSLKVVMDSEIISKLQITSSGKLSDASLSLLMSSDYNVSDGDTIIINGVEYNIIEIQTVTINDVTILYQLFLAKR